MSTPKKPSIVFVHGIWADGSSFSRVIPPLQAEGYETIAAQYGLDTLEGDVAAVKRTLRRVSGPVILAGHSYGGTLITAAGMDDRVAGLVYVAALAPDENETSQSQLGQFPTSDVLSHIEVADGRVWMKPSAWSASRGICPPRSRSSSGRRTLRPRRTCSIKGFQARPGGPSRAGTSCPKTTAPSSPRYSVSWPNGWAPPRSRWKPATFP